ncbi:maleylpyruvate isomerase family mycothiol-dependent enzyme [Nonomuraea sediminis]|uniref:maleylpyruvate isomerase family mycothiol-dependent enzyme n=1 Tax=Nonomuraea sediminis TaxID=2835864 RepID=UPI001BDD8260|nr:maleylpyruvate isomerase family mycothiol-dependent enzyme [Nonomuraea sediminis]
MIDHTAHFRREVLAFERAVRPVGEAPAVPSCPGWTVTDLIMHLGWVHRYVARIVEERLAGPPGTAERDFLGLPAESAAWPDPMKAPNPGPVPEGLVSWFADGAERLASLLDVDARVWTWSREQSVGFWARMQTIEAALHRWDAQLATGVPEPVDAELAADAVAQTFEVMAPARRSWKQAPPGEGERYLFRRTDGPDAWTVTFDGDEITMNTEKSADVEVSGSASDLMLFLWQRIPADRLTINGDETRIERYFELVPPV